MLLFNSLLAAIIISLLSFLGAISLVIGSDKLKKSLIYLISFSAGSMIGATFLHLLPEVLEKDKKSLEIFILVLIGFSIFFILERLLRWHHCHEENCVTHEHLGWLNLIGDSIHNFIDGMIILVSFAGGTSLGIIVTLSIMMHEIPQELGDFGILLYAGFSKVKALFYNFISACTALLGVLFAYWLYAYNEITISSLIPLVAGGFIYIAATDLVPEIHKDNNIFRTLISYLLFIIAIIFMYFMKIIFE